MSEALTKARCSQEEYEMARTAGILVVTTSDEIAVHQFAEAVRSKCLTDSAQAVDSLCELCALMQGVIDGTYAPDSFTLQPAMNALAALGRQPG